MRKKSTTSTGHKKDKPVSRRDEKSKQLDLDFNSRTADTGRIDKTHALKRDRVNSVAAKVYHLDDIHKKRERLDEQKHIRAIIDLVRHFK